MWVCALVGYLISCSEDYQSYFSNLSTIYQHTFETLAKTILVGRPWIASGWTGSSEGHFVDQMKDRSVTYETAKVVTRRKRSVCHDEQRLRP